MKDIWAGVVFEVPPELLELVITIPKDQWAPGVWAGSEGMQMEVKKVDLETRTITVEPKVIK